MLLWNVFESEWRLKVQGFKKLSPSVDFESEMGKEGDLDIGVFFLDIFISASWMILNGSLFSGWTCQQSYIRSYIGGKRLVN